MMWSWSSIEHGNALRPGAARTGGLRTEKTSVNNAIQPGQQRTKILKLETREIDRYAEIKKETEEKTKRSRAEEYQMENENKIVYEYLPARQEHGTPWVCMGNSTSVQLGNTPSYRCRKNISGRPSPASQLLCDFISWEFLWEFMIFCSSN